MQAATVFNHAMTDEIPDEILVAMEAGMPALRVWRDYRSFSVNELAERAGVRPELIRACEAGLNTPDAAHCEKLAAALGAPADAFCD